MGYKDKQLGEDNLPDEPRTLNWAKSEDQLLQFHQRSQFGEDSRTLISANKSQPVETVTN